MFTITDKIRAVIPVIPVIAVGASSGVASAAIPGHRLGAVTTTIVAQPTIVAQALDPSKVGSAGIPGYDNAACEQLANQVNSAEQGASLAAYHGDSATANNLYELAQEKDAELEDNCLVID